MDFELTKEQIELRNEIIQFSNKYLNEKDCYEKFSYEMWEKISQMGLLGITLDESLGGLGESYLTAAIAFEALGYSCKNNGFVFVINNHIWVAQNLIALYGSEDLKEKYIPSMVSGKRIGAIAITEADSGSDALGMRTTAVEHEDCFELTGTKMFVSNGPIADIFIVFAITNNSPNKNFTAFVVEKKFDGVKVSEDIEKMGLGACPTSEIILDHVKIPKENILGNINQGGILMTSALEWERIYEFVPHIGAMQRIMEFCMKHANSRKQFGKFIGEYQAVSHKIAEMKVRIEMARMMMYKVAWLKDQGMSAYVDSSIFKLYVSESYIQTCRDAIQILGAYGYSKEYDVERELRDAIASSIYSGTNEMQKNTIYQMELMESLF